MNKLNVYLTFNGQCADAMRFYAEALGGTLNMMTVAQSPVPEQMPAGADGNRIMHAHLVLPQGEIMAADWMEGCPAPYAGMHGFTMTLTYPTVDEAQRRFAALSQGGTITMPIGQTFWAEVAGAVTDRFGTPWMINGGKMMSE